LIHSLKVDDGFKINVYKYEDKKTKKQALFRVDSINLEI